MDENIEDFYGSCIMASSFKREFQGVGQVIIVRIGQPKGVRKTFEEELKKLTNILVNRYG
jgi:predicted RNA-binding protein with PUA domain